MIGKVHLIFGYQGYNNYGDELLASIVETHLGETCNRLSRKNSLLQHIKLIQEAHTLIGVGGLFQDLSSPLSPWYYLLVILYARISNKQIKLVGQGIGPLHSPLSKLATYISFKLADHISVRDQSSSELLHTLKIEHYYGSDLAWNLFNSERSINNDQAKFKKTLICIREVNEPFEKIITAIKDLLPDCDSDPVFLIMQNGDILFTEKVMEAMQVSAEIINANDYEPQALIKLLEENFSVMISMRLHALILAHLAGLELRAIVCDPKLDEVLLQIKEYDLMKLRQRAESSL